VDADLEEQEKTSVSCANQTDAGRELEHVSSRRSRRTGEDQRLMTNLMGAGRELNHDQFSSMALPGVGWELGEWRRRMRRMSIAEKDYRLKRRPSGCGPRAAVRLQPYIYFYVIYIFLIYIFTLYVFFDRCEAEHWCVYVNGFFVMVILLVTFLCRCVFILARFSRRVLGTCCFFTTQKYVLMS